MNNKGQVWALILFVGFLFILTCFALIEVFKDNLDSARDSDSLNCPDVAGFNQTAFDQQNATERLTFRTTCFVTGISMVWFVLAFVFAVVVWVTSNIKKSRRKR